MDPDTPIARLRRVTAAVESGSAGAHDDATWLVAAVPRSRGGPRSDHLRERVMSAIAACRLRPEIA